VKDSGYNEATSGEISSLWPPSICCARSHGLELLAWRPPRTSGLCPF